MSFILDALRKSEHARQSLGTASIAELPLGRRERGQPWWIVVIAALLLINLIVLVVVLMRDNAKVPSPAVANTSTSTTAAPATRSPIPTAQVLTGQTASPSTETRSLAEEAAPAPEIRYDTVDRSEAPLVSDPPDGPALVKRIDKSAPGAVIAETPNGLPELHIDMHVYAKQPADRFVFINSHKYVEGQTLAEGPQLEEITPDGVVLFYKGQQLRLQRP